MQRAVIDQERKDNSIQNYVKDSSLPYVDVEIKNVTRFANLVMRCHAQTTFSDTEAEIGEAVDFVVHVERQEGRRIVREVLAHPGYDRDTKRFLIEPVFEAQHASA